MSENLKPFIMEEIARRKKLELEAKIKKEELQRNTSKEYVLEVFEKKLQDRLSKVKDFKGFSVSESVENDYPYFKEEATKLGFEVKSTLAGTVYDLDQYAYVLRVPAVKDGETPTIPQERLLAFQEDLLQIQKFRQNILKIECQKVKESILVCNFQVKPSVLRLKEILVPAGQSVESDVEIQIVTDFFAELGIIYSTYSKDKLNQVYWHFLV